MPYLDEASSLYGGSETATESKPMSSVGKKEPWWKKALPLLAGAGGTALSSAFGPEAAAGFAQGFAGEKLKQLTQKRQNDMEYENFQIKSAHEATKDLAGLDLEGLEKAGAPVEALRKAKELTIKFNEALLNDGKISSKEASEIMALRHGLDPFLGQLRSMQKDEGAIREGKTQALGKQAGEVATIEQALPDAPFGPSEDGGNISPENPTGERHSRALSQWNAMNQPVRVDFNGQNLSLPPAQAARFSEIEGANQRSRDSNRVRMLVASLRNATSLQGQKVRLAIANAGGENAFLRKVIDYSSAMGTAPEEALGDLLRETGGPRSPAGAPPTTGGGVPPPPKPLSSKYEFLNP